MSIRSTVAVTTGLVLLSSCLAAAPAAAADTWGQSRGFSVGLKLLMDGMTVGDPASPTDPHIDDMGGGLALVGGYTFTPHFHTRLTLGSSVHDTNVSGLDVLHSTGTFEAHYRFRPDQQICPYLFGALGGAGVRADHDVDHFEVTGGSAGIGAGMLVSFTPHLVFDLAGRLEAISWDNASWSRDLPGGDVIEYKGAVEESGGASRLELGLIWQF